MEAVHYVASDFVYRAGYLGVYVLLLIGNLGIPTGTEFVVMFAGALTKLHKLQGNALTVGTVAMAGEITGGAIMYVAAYHGGRRLVARYGRLIGISEAEIRRAEAFFKRYGRAAVFLARFVPFVRGLDAIPAGIVRMNPGVYFASTIAGSLIFCYSLALLGATLAVRIENLSAVVSRATEVALLLPLVAVAVIVIRKLRSRAPSEAGEKG